MIPDFLAQHTDKLKALSRPSILISEEKTEALLTDPTAITQSKYLGHFFIPNTMEYPKDKTGKFLIPTVQLNFAEMPVLDGFPNEGLLQLFLPQQKHFDKSEVHVQYISKAQLELPHITDVSFLTANLYEHALFEHIYRLSFHSDISWASATDNQYTFRWDEIPEDETLADYMEELSWSDEDTYDALYDLFTGDSMGSKLGGYGYFVHGDHRAIQETIKEHILLLQIDGSDEDVFSEEASIYFHLLISKFDLQQQDFSKVFIDWQITD